MPFGPSDHNADIRDCAVCGCEFDYAGEGFRCDNCGDVHCDSCDECAYYVDDDDDGDCNCSGCRMSRNDNSVRSYSYRPRFVLKGDYLGAALLGVELEVGGHPGSIVPAVHVVDDTEDHLYMKDDGSISGVEIVTHPMSLEWSKAFDFETLLRELRSAGSYVEDGYGLHVHVSRSAFVYTSGRRAGKASQPHTMRWLLFMSRNASELQQLARRVSDQWAAFRTPRPRELRNKSVAAPYSDDRYVAVNCNNAHTYELRFFRSTLKAQELRAAMEFATASVEYTRGIRTADVLTSNALTFGHFATWLYGERDTYPNLVEEIARLGLGEDGAPTIVKPRTPEGTFSLPHAMTAALAHNASRGHPRLYPLVSRLDMSYEVYFDDWDSEYHLRATNGSTPDGWQRSDTFVQAGWSVG